MTWNFEIDSAAIQKEIPVPFLEDATGESAPNSRTTRSIEAAQVELTRWVSKLGGLITGTIPVKFDARIVDPKSFNRERDVARYGFIIEFLFAGQARGRMYIAALPLRKETPEKKKRTLAMALLNRAEFFKAAYATAIHDPHGNPLIQYLLADGERNVAQMIIERKQLALSSGVQHPENVS